MLTNALRALVYELFLKTFYEKMIKQLIFLTIFYIFHKSCVKIFLIYLLTIVLKTLVNIILYKSLKMHQASS